MKSVLLILSLDDEKTHDREDTDPYQYMKTVQPGHGVIETKEKDLSAASSKKVWRIGVDPMSHLGAPLNDICSPETAAPGVPCSKIGKGRGTKAFANGCD